MAYDISTALEPFKETATLERLQEGAFVDGKFVYGALLTAPVEVAAYPDRDELMSRLAAGERTLDTIRVFADFEIYPTRDGTGRVADYFIWHGRRYRVAYLADWAAGGYWEALCELVDNDPSQSSPIPYPPGDVPLPVVYLNDLTDVEASSPGDHQILAFDATTSKWVPMDFADLFQAEYERLIGDGKSFTDFVDSGYHTLFGRQKENQNQSIPGDGSYTWELAPDASSVNFCKILVRAVNQSDGREYLAEFQIFQDKQAGVQLAFSVSKSVYEEEFVVGAALEYDNGPLEVTISFYGAASDVIDTTILYGYEKN